MGRSLRLIVLGLFFLCSINLTGEETYSQTSINTKKELPVKMGAIEFRIREFEATPTPIRMLEIHVEVVSQSEQMTIPPNAIRIVVIPKEIQFSSPGPTGDFTPAPGEVTLTFPLPPKGIHIGIIGFSIPREKLQAISFEIQINPPEGEKRNATFQF